jgi:hypothetical protein
VLKTRLHSRGAAQQCDRLCKNSKVPSKRGSKIIADLENARLFELHTNWAVFTQSGGELGSVLPSSTVGGPVVTDLRGIV